MNYKKYYPVILIILSALIHFLFFGHPAQIVFDEVTFGKFIQASWVGDYYFDLHPPLGKWLLTIATAPFYMDKSFVFDHIGSPYKDYAFLGMRGLTTLCGTFLPLFIYHIMNRIQANLNVSFVAGLFVIFENNLLVVSRFFMLDIFLLFFGFAAILLYLKCKENFTWKLWCFTSIIASSAFLIKWTAASFVGLILLFECLEHFLNLLKYRQKINNEKVQQKKKWKKPQVDINILKPSLEKLLKRISVFCVVGGVFYYLVFAIHFELLPHSGQGDDFMTPGFQRDLVGSKFYQNNNFESLSTFEKFVELNIMLWRYHQTMHQSHPYSSTAIEWLWMKRPIYYWEDGSVEKKARIYLLGNPLLWWAGSIAIFFLLSNEMVNAKIKWQKLFSEKTERLEKPEKTEKPENIEKLEKTEKTKEAVAADFEVNSGVGIWDTSLFILILFLANFLPFFLIDRVMFIYHYNVALVVSLMALSYVLIEGFKNKYLLVFVCFIVVLTFLFFAPLTYGLPLSPEAYQLRLWFPTWL